MNARRDGKYYYYSVIVTDFDDVDAPRNEPQTSTLPYVFASRAAAERKVRKLYRAAMRDEPGARDVADNDMSAMATLARARTAFLTLGRRAMTHDEYVARAEELLGGECVALKFTAIVTRKRVMRDDELSESSRDVDDDDDDDDEPST